MPQNTGFENEPTKTQQHKQRTIALTANCLLDETGVDSTRNRWQEAPKALAENPTCTWRLTLKPAGFTEVAHASTLVLCRDT